MDNIDLLYSASHRKLRLNAENPSYIENNFLFDEYALISIIATV